MYGIDIPVIPNCYVFVDLFWIVFLFVAMRLIFDLIQRWLLDFGSRNNLRQSINEAVLASGNSSTNTRRMLNFVDESLYLAQWRELVWSVCTEAIIGFLVALFYLLYQKSYGAGKIPIVCLGQTLAYQKGIIRNSIALVVTGFILVISEWLFNRNEPSFANTLLLNNVSNNNNNNNNNNTNINAIVAEEEILLQEEEQLAALENNKSAVMSFSA